MLDQPRYGTLNIHASLLPKYRGPDPIAEAILQNDKETGVSIMLLDAGIDTGPVLLKRSIALSEDDTTGSLTLKLAELGARALLEGLPLWVGNKIILELQDEQQASYTRYASQRRMVRFVGISLQQCWHVKYGLTCPGLVLILTGVTSC